VLEGFFHYSFLGGRLMGSEHPAVLGRPRPLVEHFVRERGVRTLLTLTVPFVDYRVAGLVQHHVPIVGVPTPEAAARAVACIAEGLAAGGAVWVHCQQGLDRTGCVLGCYLVSAGEPPEQVIAEVLARFPERRRHPAFLQLWEPYAVVIRSFAGLQRRALRGSIPGRVKS
jgi:atypical dual specificity phosphatase